MEERTNDAWLADLRSEGPHRAQALDALRAHLERGVSFYLRNDRSDLTNRPLEELNQLAQDVVQDALLRILDNLDTFRGESRFTTWAAKIATRIAISELRRARHKDYSLDHLTVGGESMPSITDLAITPDEAPSPESYTERQEVLQAIDHALKNVLTEKQRIALSAYTLDGVSIEEIARRMGTNRNALYKLVHDARLKLKRHLLEQGLSLDYILDLFGE